MKDSELASWTSWRVTAAAVGILSIFKPVQGRWKVHLDTVLTRNTVSSGNAARG